MVSDSEAVEFVAGKHKVADTYEDGIAPVSYTHLLFHNFRTGRTLHIKVVWVKVTIYYRIWI